MIVYCCADMIFSTRIGHAAKDVGVTSRPARDAAMLDLRLEQVDDGKPNGPVRAVLIDLDLGPAAMEMLERVKAFDATITVVCFGAHVATDLLEQARKRGADRVLPRGQFVAELPELLARYGGA